MIRSFSGGAGCGKTWKLMDEAKRHLVQHPLGEGQKVLALTFMQGARRRLETSLRMLPGLNGHYTCETLDSFARHIVTRWRSLWQHLGFHEPGDEAFTEVCEIAANLLERPEVVRWVRQVYRLVVIDEAQDMDSVRLRIVKALAAHIDILIAADEFQCLDEKLAENPLCNWLREASENEELAVQMRTRDAEILAAASALRAGNPVPIGARTFRVLVTGNAQRTADQVNNWLSWYARRPKSSAIISPTIGPFARSVIGLVRSTKSSKRNLGPHAVRLESSDQKELEDILSLMELAEINHASQILEGASRVLSPIFALSIAEWLDRQRRTKGKTSFLEGEVASEIRSFMARRKRSRVDNWAGTRAMTVHGAKNREFDVVIVLWPTGLKWPPEQQRRLLYNAVTRAKLFCVVLLQTSKSQRDPPFA